MKTTDKQGCNILVALLAEHGVKRVVLSPGSRNAPLLMAFSRTPDIQDYVVVDERTAAFMALGMSQRSGEPVALVCTSGTALLNYAGCCRGLLPTYSVDSYFGGSSYGVDRSGR